MMWLFKKHSILILFSAFCAVVTARAQQPVFVFPDWDQVQPGFRMDTVASPLKPETVVREKIKMLVKLREMPLPKSKNKKPQPDTMAVWKFDSEGRVISYQSFDTNQEETTFGFSQGNKINLIKTTHFGFNKKQVMISYNRSGLPALVVAYESEAVGIKNMSGRMDTISLLYNTAGQLVVKNRKSRTSNMGDEEKETVTETFSYDAAGNLLSRMVHNKNGERQASDSMVIYRNKGVTEITHYHLDFVNNPGAAYAIDQVTIDTASKQVTLYAYTLATGNGNLMRNIGPGERRTYNYEAGKLTWTAFMQTGKEPHEETFFRYDEKGNLLTTFYKRKINSGAKKGTQLYDAYQVNYTYDNRGVPVMQEKKVFDNTRIINTSGFPEAGGKETVKAYERYRFVAR